MPVDSRTSERRAEGVFLPLKEPTFRGIWLASLFSNFGVMIQGVGAAWIMTQLTTQPSLVALVQTAQMAPIMVFALASGAIADMYDRRKVALWALTLGFSASAILATLGFTGIMNPAVLLVGTAVVGSAGALLAPSWQASVREQVPIEALGSAVALNSMSYNIARSFGPAIGGLIVTLWGGSAAFAANAGAYLPMIYRMARWKRTAEPARLPPEGLARAIISGVRYVGHSPPIRRVLTRAALTGLCGASVNALLPLVARDLLGGEATTLGLLLGAFGIGAVCGALTIPRLRARYSPETILRSCNLAMGTSVAIIGLSHLMPVTAFAMYVAGGAWLLSLNECNVAVQTNAPRWVSGRALAAFQASGAGGIAVGAWIWGQTAQAHGVTAALLGSAAALCLLFAAGLLLRLPDRRLSVAEAPPLSDPPVELAITPRSGPIRVAIEYSISPENARTFYGLMQQIRTMRCRSGGYSWGLARNIARASQWVETYSCPTWLDYLRSRDRPTQAERAVQAQVLLLQEVGEPVRVARWLERPLGSVRWKDESPDSGGVEITEV